MPIRRTLNKMPNAIAYWDKNENCLYGNNAYFAMFDKKAEDVIGKMSYKDLLGPERYDKYKPYVDNALNGQKQGFERELIKDNKSFIYYTSFTPDCEENEIIGFIVNTVDITEISTLQKNLKKSEEKLSIQNARLTNFAHITSHNLRAPVSTLSALLNLYKMSNEEERKEIIDNFEKVIYHMSDTLNTMIDVLRINEGSKIEPKQEVAFQKSFDKTIQMLSGFIIESHATITCDFKVPTVVFNKEYLDSVMINLISNAIKYKHSERFPIIHVATELYQDKVCLTISDNGLGIDLKRHGDKIFGLNKTFHRHPEAKGVGLYIVRNQVESMNGTISLESEENVGSVFKIIF